MDQKISAESMAVAMMCSFAVGVAMAGFMVHCDGPAGSFDAGSFDADTSRINPGVECLNRETRAAQERMYKAQEKEVDLQIQIDVLSGAYGLRKQLEKEGPRRAQQIANEVALDAGTPERLAVALKYLKDKTLEFQRTYDGGQ